MTSHAPDPLTPEERELAARLARIGPHGEPSPALDARILGAAHAAAARKSASVPRRRWPAWAGIAATLALALGAVWQLRPMQEVPVVLEETPVPVLMPRPPQPAVVAETPDAQVRAAKAVAPARQPYAEPRPEPKPSLAPPVVFDEPSPVDVPAPVAAPAPPPAPPAPPAPEAARSTPAKAAAAPSREPRALSATATPAPVPAESAANDAQSADSTARATLTVSDLPVESDRQLPPEDWIERIRQRRDAGDLASARASLALLQRDHPQLVLPDDVRAIAAPPFDR